MNKNILVISAYPPSHSLNLVKDLVDGLKYNNCNVNFVGVFDYDIKEEGYYTLAWQNLGKKKEHSWIRKVKKKIKSSSYYKFIFRRRIEQRLKSLKQYFFHLEESIPITKIEDWTNVIPNINYDLIVVSFMNGYITTSTIEDLSKRYKCPILLKAVDMTVMTGGCFYFYNCTEYKRECCNCPVISKWTREYDLPHKIFKYKKEIYSKYPIYVSGNSYMLRYFKETKLWSDSNILNIGCIVNEDFFKPRDGQGLRKKMSIDLDSFVVFSGSTVIFEERKGMKYLFEALEIFKIMNPNVKIELILAGNAFGRKVKIPNVSIHMVGMLDMEEMINMYSMADVYACPSLDDAGPSMVNQAIMCGTPVVAFNTGVAMDIVIPRQTGYKACEINANSLAICLDSIYNDYKSGLCYSELCRNFGMSNFSRKKIGQDIISKIFNPLA